MDKLDAALTGGLHAQWSVIGSMLIDEDCVPLVLSKLRPEDFVDGTCRSTFAAIRGLTREARPVDPVTVLHAMHGGDDYIGWMPMMTGAERVADFFRRMRDPEKPKYLPWGIPTADRSVYAELGDMVLLEGYASSGKTLLSILVAQTQAKAGYKVGYYSLETSPEKMTDRQFSSLSEVPLWRIKTKDLGESEWNRFVEAGCFASTEGAFSIVDASGSTVDDITSHAIGHGFQVIYVDYVQNLLVPGIRATESYAKVTTISQALKTFSRSSNVTVVALAQLSRPPKPDGKPVPPSMHSFKESGQLEQDADVAFLVYPSNPNDNTSNRIFKIGKNKEGPRPQVELVFHGETQTMVELEKRPEDGMMQRFYAEGKAIQQKNRARATQDQQIAFREVTGGDEDNPFA